MLPRRSSLERGYLVSTLRRGVYAHEGGGSRLSRIAALVLVLVLTPCALTAQVIRGTLVVEVTQEPVVGAVVSLFDANGAERGRRMTDASGAFAFDSVPTGRAYWVRAQLAGYAPVESRPFVLERQHPDVVLNLATRRAVVALEGLTVPGTRETRNFAGFLNRKEVGFGRYFGPEDIVRQRVNLTSNLLTGMAPGMDVISTGVNRGVLLFTNRGRSCMPVIVVDNLVYDPRRGGPVSVDDIVPGAEIRAVEVYTMPAFVPPEVTLAPFNDCGAVVIWTAFGLGVD